MFRNRPVLTLSRWYQKIRYILPIRQSACLPTYLLSPRPGGSALWAPCHKVGWLSRLGILYSLILYSFDNKRLWSQGPWEKRRRRERGEFSQPRTGPLIYPSSRDQQGSLPRFWSTVSLRVTSKHTKNLNPFLVKP